MTLDVKDDLVQQVVLRNMKFGPVLLVLIGLGIGQDQECGSLRKSPVQFAANVLGLIRCYRFRRFLKSLESSQWRPLEPDDVRVKKIMYTEQMQVRSLAGMVPKRATCC